MRLVIASVATVCCILAVGCSQESPLNSGTVLSKSHQPEKKWVRIILIPIIMTGKSTITTFTPIPMFHRQPEHWILIIRGTVKSEGREREEQRKLYVPRETYDKVSIGDTYTVQVADKTDLPIEKRQASNEEKLVYGVQPANSRQ